jgi:GH43 family beta-xylosidase
MFIISLILFGVLQAGLVAAFQNPIRNPGPDPSMVYADGMYYLTFTGYDHISITRSQTLAGLLNGETKTIWTDSDTTKNANMWAPEIHQIDDIWYMFYSSCNAKLSCCDSCRTRVLKGCVGANPYDCTYSYLAELTPPVGGQGGANKDFAFSIDGTYLEIEGKGRYHVVSAVNYATVLSLTLLRGRWKAGTLYQFLTSHGS